MKGSGRGSLLMLLLAVFIVGSLTALGWLGTSSQSIAAVALLAIASMLAAAFCSVLITAVMGVLALAAGAAVAMLGPSHVIDDYLVALAGLAVALILAIAIAIVKSRSAVSAATHSAAQSAAEAEAHPVLPVRVQASVDTDPMTGLLNRRGAIRSLGHRNTEGDRVVAFLDCDLFRAVNETYGSAVGDEFLQAIAGRLRHSLPAHDTVARWDGDEFLVAISADSSAAMKALERVVGAINGHPIRTTAGPIEASMSVGAAVWTAGQDLEDVISRAGRALHTAKSSGRGQAVLDRVPGGTPSVGDASQSGA